MILISLAVHSYASMQLVNCFLLIFQSLMGLYFVIMSLMLDFLQVFVGKSEDNLSTLQLKVHNLEHAVDKIAKSISQNGNYSNMTNSKFTRSNQNVSSPRLSTSTPRLSVESNYRESSLSSLNSKEVWDVNESSRGRSSTSVKKGIELWRDPTLNIVRNNIPPKGSVRSTQNTASRQKRETRDALSISDHHAIVMQSKIEGKNGFWSQMKEFLHSGDVESAYAATLCAGDDLYLIELMDRTGPVLERLSCETSNAVINILTTNFLNQRFMDSIIPWFLQASSSNSNNFKISLFSHPFLASAACEACNLSTIHSADVYMA